MARDERFGIGTKIDTLQLEILDMLRTASFVAMHRKPELLAHAIGKTDSLRFFIQIAWDAKLISNKHFEELGSQVEAMGRMVGGWRKGLLAKNSAQ